MAKRKEGHEVLFVEVPQELKERLRVVAERNRRSMNGEAVVAIERYLAAEEAAEAEEAARLAEPTAQKAKGKKKGGAK
jgi:predicted transcriptional regulator